MNEPEIVETKPNKVKIILSILVSALIVAATAILLVGHFKFDWFKSDEYKIDAHINRSVYQANYFSETKTISTKFNFHDGKTEEKEYIIDNKFVVFLTEKKDKLNTAALVILSSTATIDDKLQELAHLDIFDEKQIKELEANPNGSKYPMAVFKFTDVGKIEEIKLPNNMDEYNAESIIDLIKKVIPKLTRNKKEDISNGLEITSKKVNSKRTIIQSEAPREYEYFKGSRYSRVIKTEIENDQITNVVSDDNLYMESQPEEKEILYGPKDFHYDIKSEINSDEIKYNEKDNIDLVNKLAEKFILIDSEELLQIFTNQKEEKNKEIYQQQEIVEEETKPVRQLFPISGSKPFNLATFDVLGQKVNVKYVVGVSGNSAYNKIVISSGLGSFEFGNSGCSATFEVKKSYSQPIFVFTCPFPFFFVSVGCYVKGSVYAGLGFKSGSGAGTQYWAKAEGSLALGAEVKAGWDQIVSLSAYAEGTVISASAKVTISNGSVTKDSGFKLTVGRLEVGIRGAFLGNKGTLWSTTLYNGYTLY